MFLLLFLISLLLLSHLSLSTLTTLLFDLRTTSELVPHLAGTLHEVFVFHLLEPALVEVRQLAALGALLTICIGCIRFRFLHYLLHSNMLNCAFTKLRWLLAFL